MDTEREVLGRAQIERDIMMSLRYIQTVSSVSMIPFGISS